MQRNQKMEGSHLSKAQRDSGGRTQNIILVFLYSCFCFLLGFCCCKGVFFLTGHLPCRANLLYFNSQLEQVVGFLTPHWESCLRHRHSPIYVLLIEKVVIFWFSKGRNGAQDSLWTTAHWFGLSLQWPDTHSLYSLCKKPICSISLQKEITGKS